MNKTASVLIAFVLAAGCRTVPSADEMAWVRTDGHQLTDDPTYYATKFEIDRIVCVGGVQKSAVGTPVIYYQGLAGTIDARTYQDVSGKAVLDLMKDCMAGRHYVLVPKTQAAATSAEFRKYPRKP